MKSLRFLMLFLGISSLTYAQQIVKMQVKENTEPCVGVAPMDCLQVKIGKSKEWSHFYSSIEGFNYEPGYRYRLKVEQTKREGKLPADVSAYQYKLKKVVCKKKVKSKVKENKQSMEFQDKKMILTQLNGNNVSGGNVYVTFDSAAQTIYGKSGCNQFSGSYKLQKNQVKVTTGMGTLMACDEASMKLEREFLKALDSDNFLVKQTNEEVVFINSKNNAIVMKFEIPTAKSIWSFIDGKKWKLIQLDHVSKDYGKAFITFNVKDKKVSGNSGCNNFFGTFSTNAEEVTFSGLGSTRMACLDENQSKTESQVLAYLSNQNLRFDVAEQTLNFYKGDKLVMMMAWVQE